MEPYSWSEEERMSGGFAFVYNVKHEDFMTTWSTNYTNWNLGSNISIIKIILQNGTNRAVPLKKFTSIV